MDLRTEATDFHSPPRRKQPLSENCLKFFRQEASSPCRVLVRVVPNFVQRQGLWSDFDMFLFGRDGLVKTRYPHKRCCTWSRERSQADKAKATQVENFGVKKVLETQLPKLPSTPENKQALLVPPQCLQPPWSCCPHRITTRLAPKVDIVAHGASRSHQYAVSVCVAGQGVCCFFLQPLETSAKRTTHQVTAGSPSGSHLQTIPGYTLAVCSVLLSSGTSATLAASSGESVWKEVCKSNLSSSLTPDYNRPTY